MSSIESYLRQGSKHIGSSCEVTWEEVRAIQRKVTAHAKGIAKAVTLGEAQGDRNAQRTWDNVTNDSSSVPSMKLLPKTHKPVDEMGDPKTRPVVGASCSLNARAGDLLTNILVGVVKGADEQLEAESSEHVLSSLEDAEDIIEKEAKRVVVGSLDAVGLFPNLDVEEAAKECRLEIEESKVEFQGHKLRTCGSVSGFGMFQR